MCSRWPRTILLAAGVVLSACSPETVQRNPFLAYTDEYGVAGQQQTADDESASGGAQAEGFFRGDLTIRIRNNHPGAEANFALVAWVNVGSIRSAEQQDALMRSGYSQLSREVRLGTAHVLPIGTFVYDGGGTAGATAVVLARAQSTADGQNQTTTPSEFSLTLTTPDAILLFSQPPVSCESVAFYFTDDGDPLTSDPVAGSEAPYAGATLNGGFKTLAQVDAYECSPFRPGLFFSTGGARDPNEYLEGDDVTFDLFERPNAEGAAAVVTIGAEAPLVTVETEQSTGEDQGGTEPTP